MVVAMICRARCLSLFMLLKFWMRAATAESRGASDTL